MSFSNRVVRKWDPSYDTDEKLSQSYTFFFRKRGLILYLAALKKGAIRATHPYDVIYSVVPVDCRYVDKAAGLPLQTTYGQQLYL